MCVSRNYDAACTCFFKGRGKFADSNIDQRKRTSGIKSDQNFKAVTTQQELCDYISTTEAFFALIKICTVLSEAGQ